MSTMIESVKELLGKIPNLPELIKEAQRQPERPVSDICYVYNGYDDITLKYLGMYSFTFKRGEVTKINAIEYREPDQSKSEGKNIVYQNHHLPGESIARELIETRKFGDKGLAVFIEGPEAPKRLKDECDAKGLAYRLRKIEEFKVNREKAKAGTAGFKIRPDVNVARWLQEHSPDDEYFATQHTKTAANTTMADAVSKLTTIVETLVAKDSAKAEEAKGPVLTPPKRKPMESPEAHQARVNQWKVDNNITE